jgi:hypothetical protein
MSDQIQGCFFYAEEVCYFFNPHYGFGLLYESLNRKTSGSFVNDINKRMI